MTLLPPSDAATSLSPYAVAGLQVVGTFVGALVGGAIAWFTAMRKLKNERAFDRRLEWHERMHHCLVAGSATMRQLCWELKENPEFSIEDAARSVDAALKEIKQHRIDAALYADPPVIRCLADLRDNNYKHVQVASDRLNREMAISTIRNVDLNLAAASYAVAIEVRRHLGVKPMTTVQLADAVLVSGALREKMIPARTS
jgi:hypothetical protein